MKSQKYSFARHALIFSWKWCFGNRCSNNSSHARLRSETHAKSNWIHNKSLLFFLRKLMMRVFFLVFEPSKNRFCIDEYGWVVLFVPLKNDESQKSHQSQSNSKYVLFVVCHQNPFRLAGVIFCKNHKICKIQYMEWHNCPYLLLRLLSS
jgi:hypothetical protein